MRVAGVFLLLCEGISGDVMWKAENLGRRKSGRWLHGRFRALAIVTLGSVSFELRACVFHRPLNVDVDSFLALYCTLSGLKEED